MVMASQISRSFAHKLNYHIHQINPIASIFTRSRSYSTQREDEYDVVVVGGGIVGMATARELAIRHPKLKLAVLEKENRLAAHQSGHNSGVVHAGIYYKPGTLKARLCVEGLHLSYKYFEEKGVPYKKCGKLVVAVEKHELPRLDDLHERAMQNGVPDLQMIEGSQIKEIEPYCQGLKALWSPHTGIVDWGLVTRYYGKDFEESGGQIHLNFKVVDFQLAPESQNQTSTSSQPNEYLVRVTGDQGQSMRCRYVLTCGGLQSDRLAVLSGCPREPRILPFRGEYLLLNPAKNYLVKGNIYPVPDPRFPFLGTHFTPRMDGSVWLGPNAVLSLKREGYRWRDIDLSDISEAVRFRGFQKLAAKYFSFGVKEMLRSAFIGLQLKELQKFIPQVNSGDITRGPAGVRAQAMDHDGNLVDDFVFDSGEGELGRRVLHCRNAPSPGATSSLAIAKMIADRAENDFQL